MRDIDLAAIEPAAVLDLVKSILDDTDNPETDSYLVDVARDAWAFARSCECGAELRSDIDDEDFELDFGKWRSSLLHVGSRHADDELVPDPLFERVADLRRVAREALHP